MARLPDFPVSEAANAVAAALARAKAGGVAGRLAITAPWHPRSAADLVAMASRSDAFVWIGARTNEHLVAVGRIDVLSAEGDDRFHAIGVSLRSLAARISTDTLRGAPNRAPRFFGGFGFDNNSSLDEAWAGWPAAEFALPAAIFGRDAEGFFQQRIVIVDPRDTVSDILARLAPAEASAAPPRHLPLVAGAESAAQYLRHVEAAVAEISQNSLGKVVVARRQSVDHAVPIEIAALVGALADHNPAATTFAVRVPGRASFVGASPERLVRVSGRKLQTVALAGTAPRVADLSLDEQVSRLRNSAKDRAEHHWVDEVVRQTLAPFATVEASVSEPDVRVLPDLLHLERKFVARLHADADLFALLEALHPTPAVGGVPQQRALATIKAQEGDTRGWYAGAVGWISARFDADLVVALRSALVAGNRALLYAGAGIVGGSEPFHELAETEAKMLPMRRALDASSSAAQ